jgi:hypothetical protein
MAWYSVRCIFEWTGGIFEERTTLWSAESIDEAIKLAEQDAREHAAELGDGRYLGLAQAYEIGPDQPGSGDEVYSLMRDSDLPADQYLSTYFDTGQERTQNT